MSQGKELTYEQKQAIVHVKKFMDYEKGQGKSISTERQTLDILQLPAAEARQMLGADSLLTSTITAWDTRKLKTDNTVLVAASFALVDLDTKSVLWEAEWPYGPVSIQGSQPWHDVRYYISRLVDEAFVTLP